MRGQAQAHSSVAKGSEGAKDTWRTPAPLLDRVRLLGPIVCDPCSNLDASTGALVNYSGPDGNGDDGLALPWARRGEGLTYVNWVYSHSAAWAKKIVVEAKHGAQIVGLGPARPDTAWHRHLMTEAVMVGFYRGRIKFELPPGIVGIKVRFTAAPAAGADNVMGEVFQPLPFKKLKAGDYYVEVDQLDVVRVRHCLAQYARVEEVPLAPAPFPSALFFFNLDPGAINVFAGVCDLYRKIQ